MRPRLGRRMWEEDVGAIDPGLGRGGLGEDSLAGGGLFEVVVPAYFPGRFLEYAFFVSGLAVLSIELEILNFEITGP